MAGYDPDELLMIKGSMITKEVIFHKVKALGWNGPLFGQLNDDEIIQVLENRKTPAQMGKSLATTFVPNGQPAGGVNLDSDEGSDPSVMGPMGSQPREDLSPVPLGQVLESGVVVAGVAPPSHAGKHIRPVDPTRPQQPSQPGLPVTPPYIPQTPVRQPVQNIVVKPPKTDTAKLMSMLDAAFQLSGNDATMNTAKVLVQTNGLERAFQALYPELAKKVLGRFDATPDVKCRGGTVLDIELEAESGYVHIITSAGTITITGHNLTHKGAEA